MILEKTLLQNDYLQVVSQKTYFCPLASMPSKKCSILKPKKSSSMTHVRCKGYKIEKGDKSIRNTSINFSLTSKAISRNDSLLQMKMRDGMSNLPIPSNHGTFSSSIGEMSEET